MRKPLFKEFFVLLIVVGVLNYLATINNWYWLIRPFDSLMHFLGGAWVALFFLWLYFYSGIFAPTRRDLLHFILITILGVGFIAVAWEVYELLLGEVEQSGVEYPFDTTLDFIMDFLGALAACLYSYLREHSLSYAKN